MLLYEQFHQPRLRVVVVTPGLSPGGAEIWLSTLVQRAVGVRYTALVHAGMSGDILGSTFAGVPICKSPGIDSGSIGDTTRDAVRQYGADLVVMWGLSPVSLFRHGLGVPTLHVSHSTGEAGEETNEGHRHYVDHIGDSACNYLAAVSRGAAKIFPERLTRRSKVHIVHNGSDVERVAPRFGPQWQRTSWGLPEEARVLLFNGRFNDGKRPDLLIDALQFLPDDWHLVLHGWGEMAASLRAKAATMPRSSLGTKSRVIFPLPGVRSLGDVLAASDVFCLPSKSEAFPLSVIEAWQAGVPVVASDLDFLREVETTYNAPQAAIRVPLQRPTAQDIAKAVLEAAESDPVDIEALQELALQQMSAAAMVGRWESLFFQLVTGWLSAGIYGVADLGQ